MKGFCKLKVLIHKVLMYISMIHCSGFFPLPIWSHSQTKWLSHTKTPRTPNQRHGMDFYILPEIVPQVSWHPLSLHLLHTLTPQCRTVRMWISNTNTTKNVQAVQESSLPSSEVSSTPIASLTFLRYFNCVHKIISHECTKHVSLTHKCTPPINQEAIINLKGLLSMQLVAN